MLPRSFARLAIATVVALSTVPTLVQAGALTDLLVGQIGVTPPQADGGAGSIFKLARAQMTPENFQKLRTVIPGLDGYLGAAPAFLPGEQPAPAANAGSLGKAAALASLAGGGSKAGAVAGLAGGGSTTGALAGAALGGGSTSGALAGAALGGGSSKGALAAAALGQPPSPTAALQGAAGNKLAASVGGAVPGVTPAAQGGLADLAAGTLAGNAGGGSTVGAAGALLAGTTLGDKLQAVQTLAPAFQQLGMNRGLIAQFLPVVVNYVKSVGGKSSSKLLTHALGL